MNFGGRRNEGVHGVYRPTSGFRPRYQLAPCVGNSTIDRQDPILEAQWQLIPEPFVEPLPPSASGHEPQEICGLTFGLCGDFPRGPGF